MGLHGLLTGIALPIFTFLLIINHMDLNPVEVQKSREIVEELHSYTKERQFRP
jgi:hypothetical protein